MTAPAPSPEGEEEARAVALDVVCAIFTEIAAGPRHKALGDIVPIIALALSRARSEQKRRDEGRKR
jgi:hypothetical protein